MFLLPSLPPPTPLSTTHWQQLHFFITAPAHARFKCPPPPVQPNVAESEAVSFPGLWITLFSMTETSVCIEQDVFAEEQDSTVDGAMKRVVSWFQWLTNGKRGLRKCNKQTDLEVTCVHRK